MSPRPPARADLIAKIRAERPARHFFHLRFPDLIVKVMADSAELLAALERYFAPFVIASVAHNLLVTLHQAPALEPPFAFTPATPEPGKDRIKDESAELGGGRAVRKRLTGMLFVFGGEDHLAVGPCLEHLNQAVNFINSRYMDRLVTQGFLLGHASAVASGGRGVAIAGASGMGKSTLALKLVGRGAVFISNDRSLVRRDPDRLVLRGVAKLPRVNPGAIVTNPELAGLLPAAERDRFLGLDPDALWRIEQKHDVPLEALYGPDRFQLEASLDSLYILHWGRGQGPLRLTPVDLTARPDLLDLFIKPHDLFIRPRPGHPDQDRSRQDYAQVLGPCPAFELEGGVDFDRAAELIQAQVLSHAKPQRKKSRK